MVIFNSYVNLPEGNSEEIASSRLSALRSLLSRFLSGWNRRANWRKDFLMAAAFAPGLVRCWAHLEWVSWRVPNGNKESYSTLTPNPKPEWYGSARCLSCTLRTSMALWISVNYSITIVWSIFRGHSKLNHRCFLNFLKNSRLRFSTV